MIKEVDKNFRDTVIALDGSETEVRFSAKYSYFALMNNSDGNVIMSFLSDKKDTDDGVRIVLPGQSAVIAAPGMSDRIFVQGTGRVQISAMTDPINPFKQGARGGDNSGGGGGKSQDVICGAAEYVGGGIKSIPVTMVGNQNESFAAALAEATGWTLQPDGVSVLNGDVGFRFIDSNSHYNGYVCLVNNEKNTDTLYLDNLQYLRNTGSSYCIDICKSPNGAVAFGFRREDETPKLTFMMTKDGNGDSVCMATYYTGLRLEWAKKDDTSTQKIEDNPLRAFYTESPIIGLFKLADCYSGGLLEDCYCVYLTNHTISNNLEPGEVVSIDGNRFAIIYNHIYDKDGQVWLAMPIT